MESLWLASSFLFQLSSSAQFTLDTQKLTPIPAQSIPKHDMTSFYVCTTLVAAYIFYTVMAILYGQVRATRAVFMQMLFLLMTVLLVTSVVPSAILNVTITVIIIYILSENLPQAHLDITGKAILITGCDQGIGHELAKKLDRMGLYVFAGCLIKDGPGEQALREQCSDRLKTVHLDVRDVEQAKSAAQFVEDNLGENKLWGIVNNAGICFIGNVEMMTSEDMQKIMAVNYFGPVNVCKAFLPLLRRSKGRLVNVASNAGLAPVPLMGVYCASKAALATMTEVWRFELQAWGINVSMIVPSGYKTGILGYDKDQAAERWWNAASEAVRNDYGKDCFHIKFKKTDHESVLNSDLSPITGSIVDALLAKKPQTFYYRGILSRALPFLYMHLPVCVSNPVMKVLADWFDFSPEALKTSTSKQS